MLLIVYIPWVHHGKLFLWFIFEREDTLIKSSAHWGQKRESVPLEKEIQVIVNHPGWVLTIELRSFGRRENALNHRAIAPASGRNFLRSWFPEPAPDWLRRLRGGNTQALVTPKIPRYPSVVSDHGWFVLKAVSFPPLPYCWPSCPSPFRVQFALLCPSEDNSTALHYVFLILGLIFLP